MASLAGDDDFTGNVLGAAGRVVAAEAVGEDVGEEELLCATKPMYLPGLSSTRSTTAVMPEAVVTWIADQRRPAMSCG